MSKYIDAEHVLYRMLCCGTYHGVIAFDTVKSVINDAPSIDICFCRECKYSEKTSSPITALWCKRFGLKDMAVEADDFCSYGEREGE